MSALPSGGLLMPPRRISNIAREAEMARREWLPHRNPFVTPRVDMLELVDVYLPRHGIHVYPAKPDELPAQHALTLPWGAPGDPITILMTLAEWDDLAKGGSLARHPTATVAHELGHARFHVEPIRRGAIGLARSTSRVPRTIEQPEWQAWTFAGFFLMPPEVIRQLAPKASAAELAELFGVSVDFAQKHRARLIREDLM